MILAMLGIAICTPSIGSTDFGQIHFLGSVLYSGCYVQAINRQYRTETQNLSEKGRVHHFDLNLTYCRLVDNGKVLAEIALATPGFNDYQVFLKNEGRYHLVESDLHGRTLNSVAFETLSSTQSQLELQTRLTKPYFDSTTKKSFDIELIYR